MPNDEHFWSKTFRGHSLQNKRYREAHYDKRKADPIESLACARFAVVEKPQPMPAPDAAFGALRNTVAALEACATNLTRPPNGSRAGSENG